MVKNPTPKNRLSTAITPVFKNLQTGSYELQKIQDSLLDTFKNLTSQISQPTVFVGSAPVNSRYSCTTTPLSISFPNTVVDSANGFQKNNVSYQIKQSGVYAVSLAGNFSIVSSSGSGLIILSLISDIRGLIQQSAIPFNPYVINANLYFGLSLVVNESISWGLSVNAGTAEVDLVGPSYFSTNLLALV